MLSTVILTIDVPSARGLTGPLVRTGQLTGSFLRNKGGTGVHRGHVGVGQFETGGVGHAKRSKPASWIGIM